MMHSLKVISLITWKRDTKVKFFIPLYFSPFCEFIGKLLNVSSMTHLPFFANYSMVTDVSALMATHCMERL